MTQKTKERQLLLPVTLILLPVMPPPKVKREAGGVGAGVHLAGGVGGHPEAGRSRLPK
jgi:hypothetical protein